MRERWVDDGQGTLCIDTDKMHMQITSRSYRNYRTKSSTWSLYFYVKRRYIVRFWDTFGGTLEEAMQRAEEMMSVVYESIQEII